MTKIDFWRLNMKNSRKMIFTTKMAFLSLFCCFLLKFSVLVAQKATKTELKEFSEYEKSLKSYYLKLWHAKREEFKDLNEKSFLYYAPSIGLQFGLPSIQFSTKDYANYKRDRMLHRSKLNSLDASLELEMNERLQGLEVEHNKIKLEYDKLAVYQGKLKYLRSLHEIKQECCRRRECTPEDCKKADLELYGYEEQEKLMELEIGIKILDLEKLSKYKLPMEHFTR